MIIILIGRPYWATVPSSWIFIWKLASPDIQITCSSGCATCAPIAAGNPYPIVPNPALVNHLLWLVLINWAAHIWCCPTSVVKYALFELELICDITSCGDKLFAFFGTKRGYSFLHLFSLFLHAFTCSRSIFPSFFNNSNKSWINSFTSPTIPTWGVRFLPTSAGSISTCITCAWHANSSNFPVTRSSNLAPRAINRSHSLTA